VPLTSFLLNCQSGVMLEVVPQHARSGASASIHSNITRRCLYVAPCVALLKRLWHECRRKTPQQYGTSLRRMEEASTDSCIHHQIVGVAGHRIAGRMGIRLHRQCCSECVDLVWTRD
jgi:hypothetical protein